MATTPKLRIQIPGVMTSEECIRQMRQRQDVTLLAFSCGKDSIAAWLAIREHFDVILPVYRYTVPGLEFVEESLAYYEKFFGTRIARIPHPSTYRLLRNLIYQSPEHCLVIESCKLPKRFDYVEGYEQAAIDAGLPPETFAASGVRAADSPLRRLHFKKRGPLSEKARNYYPVWDYSKAGIVDIMRRAGVKAPRDYAVFGRSFDGIDYRFMAPMKRHFPRDYQRLVEWFPLIEAELFRFERAKRGGKR